MPVPCPACKIINSKKYIKGITFATFVCLIFCKTLKKNNYG